MNPEAIWMTIIGFAILYGGLAFCIGIAWYHGKQQKTREQVWDSASIE